MSDLRARLRIEGDASSAVAAGAQTERALKGVRGAAEEAARGLGATDRQAEGLARSAGQVAGSADRADRALEQVASSSARAAAGLDRADRAAGGLNRSAGQAHAAVGLLGAGLAAVGGAAIAREISDVAMAAAGLTLGMGAVTGGAQQGAEQLAYAADQADRLGLVAQDASRSLLSLSAATNGTELAGQKTRDIWLATAEAGMVLGRTPEQIGRGLAALEQIAGKGVVSMEEVRQQLAEAIPGAAQISARAMGLSSAEFNKLVESGKLLSTDFLPKFAAQLREEYGPSIDAYLTTPMGLARVEMGRFETNVRTLQETSGRAFLTGLSDGLSRLNEELSSPEGLARAEALGEALAQGATLAADALILVSDNLDLVVGTAQALAAVGLVRFLAAASTEARASAVAYALKGAAARAASESAVAGAVAESSANVGLRAGLQAIAKAEADRAAAALAAAKAVLAAANATATEARQTLAATGAGVAYVDAKVAATRANAALIAAENGVAAAAGRVTAAQRMATASTTAMAGAMTMARGAGGALLAMMGGPWGAALLAAGGAVWLLTGGLREQAEAERELYARIDEKHAALKASEAAADQARIETGNLTAAEMSAAVQAAALTGEQHKLADAYYVVAAAAKAAALAQNAREILGAKADVLRAEVAERGAARRLGAAMALGPAGAVLQRRYAQGAGEAAAQRSEAQEILAGAVALRPEIRQSGLEEFAPARPTAGGDGGGAGDDKKGRGRGDRSADILADLKLEAEGYRAQAIAAAQGEAALDAWRIAEAGRQAVARAGTEVSAETAAQIREQAEEVERLGIIADRVQQASSFERQARADTAALERRAVAVAGGRQAMEALRVTEAGLESLARLRVQSLSELSGPERAAAEAAMRAAEAKERQAIATEKAEAAAGAVEDLDRRTAAEIRRTASIGQGAAAEVEYARAEYVRQAVEQAGLEITDEAAKAIIRKAEALFALTAATDAASEADDFEEQLRLSRLSNREREIAVRQETILRDLIAQQVGEYDEAVLAARARAQAVGEAWRADWAQATGEIADNMRQQFIENGELAFDDMGKALERQLRAAIYDALLAKPINMVINAVMDGAQGGLSSLLGGSGGAGGLGGLFGGAGGLGGLGGSIGAMLPVIGQIAAVAAMGSALSGGIAGALGGNSKKASQWGMLGLVPGLIAGLTDKADRPYARADVEVRDGKFVFAGAQAADGGDKEGISKAGQALADQLNTLSKTFGLDLSKLGGLYTTIGKTEGGNAKALGGDGFFGGAINGTPSLAGQRDVKGLTLGRGVGFSQEQDAEAVTEKIIRDTILRAINAGASDLSEAEKRFVAAAESLEEAVNFIEKSRGFSQALEDSILQFTDPAAYEKKKALDAIEASYQALKTEAQEMVSAGLISGDVMARLDKLKQLQVEDALKKLAGSAEEAEDALLRLQPGLRQWLDRQLLGANAPLNPLEQRNAAFQQYEDVLARALAGDEDALSSLTDYADRLLSADRVATSDASARAMLFEEVMADVRALATKPAADPVAQAIADMGEEWISRPIVEAIEQIPEAPDTITVSNMPDWLGSPQIWSGGGGSADLDAVSRSIGSLVDQLGAGMTASDRRLDMGLAANSRTVADSLGSLKSSVDALVAETRTQNTFLRQSASRIA